MENQKNIPGFSNYQVTSDGDVYSLNYMGLGYRKRLLSHKDRGGYHLITLVSDDGKRKNCQLHRLVALAFLGESGSHEVNHIDGNKSNNRLSNLEYCTRSENVIHSFKIGLRQSKKGEAHNSAKLTESTVLEIRKLSAGGMSKTNIAKMVSLSIGQVSRIANRKSWRHV